MLPLSRCIESLRCATDERAIHTVLTDYVSQITGDPGALPPEISVLISNRESEIHDIAVGLLQAEMAFTGDDATAKLLWETALVFAGAASRIGHIRSRIHREPR